MDSPNIGFEPKDHTQIGAPAVLVETQLANARVAIENAQAALGRANACLQMVLDAERQRQRQLSATDRP